MTKRTKHEDYGDDFANTPHRHSHGPWQPPYAARRPLGREARSIAGTLVSVVVPTCGRPQLLNRCLAALVDQHLDPASYELIVVDDAPSEDVKTLVMAWATRTLGHGPIVGYIPNKGPHGPAAARNVGWRAACGEIIAFTDDDAVPDRDWLRNGVQAFTGGVHAAWGRIVMPVRDAPTDYELDAKNLERAEFVTANCFCLRSVLEEVNGFDTDFHVAWREDSDLHFRLLDRRARIVHVPEAVVVHPVRPARWGVSLWQQKKVVFDALLYKKHPALYREKICARPRWDYYLIVLCLLGIAAAALLGAPALAGVFGALWTGLTLALVARRLRPTSKSPRHVLEMLLTSALIPPLAVFWRIVGALRFRAPLL